MKSCCAGPIFAQYHWGVLDLFSTSFVQLLLAVKLLTSKIGVKLNVAALKVIETLHKIINLFDRLDASKERPNSSLNTVEYLPGR